jgi:hypothetical protein
MELGHNADRGLTIGLTDGAAVRSSGPAHLAAAKNARPNLTRAGMAGRCYRVQRCVRAHLWQRAETLAHHIARASRA